MELAYSLSYLVHAWACEAAEGGTPLEPHLLGPVTSHLVSPELDDDGISATRVPMKLHKCSVCELPVAALFHMPQRAGLHTHAAPPSATWWSSSLVSGTSGAEQPAAAATGAVSEAHAHELPLCHHGARCQMRAVHEAACLASSVECIPDLIFVHQFGPICGAASVAGTLLSLAAYHGLDWHRLRQSVDAAFVQKIYADMGVPGVERTTARVGNLTLKRAFINARLPEYPRARCVVTDFGCLFEKDERARMLAEWTKLKHKMMTGHRFLYHSRNHYNRVFGWREVHCSGQAECQRYILMAKRGQRPQHWVPWEAVYADTRKHNLHKIIEVKLTFLPG